jgi:hypothetical protein
MAITTDDRLELHELPGRYGDAIDDRDWAGLDRIFYVDDTADGVKLNFRIVALRRGGLAGTASYYDDVVKTDQGWRVSHRVVTLRRRPR